MAKKLKISIAGAYFFPIMQINWIATNEYSWHEYYLPIAHQFIGFCQAKKSKILALGGLPARGFASMAKTFLANYPVSLQKRCDIDTLPVAQRIGDQQYIGSGHRQRKIAAEILWL